MLQKIQVLSGTTLKIIALVIMTIDHIGMVLFPSVIWLRIIGRLAMPVFAFMIVEGCYYTHNRLKYFLQVAVVGIVFQVLILLFIQSFYQFILITFSMSIPVIYAFQELYGAVFKGEKGRIAVWCIICFAALLCAWLICSVLPDRLVWSDFEIDYGFYGVILPLLVYIPNFFMKKGSPYYRPVQLLLEGIGILLLVSAYGTLEAWALFSLILLLLYNGRRGRLRIKYFFYLYFPLHLGLLYFIDAFLMP